MVSITQDAQATDSYDFTIKKSATRPSLSAQLTDEDDNAIDLTGARVRFRMSKPDSDTLDIDTAATIEEPSNGKVIYMWSDGDTDTAGFYNAEFAVDYSGDTGNNFDPDEFFPAVQFLTVYIEENL